MFELEEVRTWERNPQVYADILASSLAAQALFTYAPEAERARRVLSKLRQVPRLIQAARDNIKEPPGIFVKVGIETMRGALTFIDATCRARSPAWTTCTCSAISPTRPPEAVQAVGALRRRTSRTRCAPRRGPRSGWAARSSSRSCGSKRASRCRVERLLAIAMRELRATQEAFRTVAGAPERRRPAGGLARGEGAAPAPGELDRRRRGSSSRSSPRSSSAQGGRHACPTASRRRGADAGVLPLVVREHVDARARSRPSRSRAILLPDRRRPVVVRRAAGRAPARLQLPDALVDLDARGLPRPLPALPAPAAGRVEGAQVDHVRAGVVRGRLGALLRADDGRGRASAAATTRSGSASSPRRSSASPASSSASGCTPRTCRWSRACGSSATRRIWRKASARREAERGTFDPTYLVYTAGKLMLLKLRQDWKEQQGARLSLRAFHDTLLAQGTAPFWVHRQLHARTRRPARTIGAGVSRYAALRIPVRRLRAPLRGDPEVLGRARSTVCPKCGGTVQKLLSSPAIQFKGSGWYITDYARKARRQDRQRQRRRAREERSPAASLGDDSKGSSESKSRRARRPASRIPAPTRRR